MTKILAVDPGLRGCGVAVFDTEILGSGILGQPHSSQARLLWARYVRNPVRQGDDLDAISAMAEAVGDLFRLSAPDTIALEFPKVYAGSKAVGDPHDLLTLAAIDGAILAKTEGNASRLVRYFPRDWKGQLDKDTCAARVRARLDAGEIASIELPCTSLQHNVWDAIGIGLKACGRFEPVRVIARGNQAPGA